MLSISSQFIFEITHLFSADMSVNIGAYTRGGICMTRRRMLAIHPDLYLWSANSPISQIPQCIRRVSHTIPFLHTRAYYCYKEVHCGIWDWCIEGFVQQVYCLYWRLHAFTHDYVIKWKHFPRYWPFVRGIHRSPVNSAHKGQWRGALMFTLIYVWTNGWLNNREAGDLRRYRAHYDVRVMFPFYFLPIFQINK